jgi:pSer/pThr/pTyr-binding forkhead associated (FHA) protein
LIVIGSRRGNLVFSDDPFLSPQHATLGVKNGQLFLRDDSSASGVFVSISGHEIIQTGSLFSAGQRLFRYLGVVTASRPPSSGVLLYGAPVPQGQLIHGLEEILIGARSGRIAVTATQILSIGRSNCDISFPNDAGLAPRHCELTFVSQGAILRDLSGGLGTFVRIPSGIERLLHVGDLVRVGQEILRVDPIA